MKSEYKRDLQNNYLILEVEKEEEEQSYGLVMAEKNEIQGLLKFHCSRKDGILFIHYEVTSKQTLETIYEKKFLGYQDILHILTELRDIFGAMQRYLLNPGNLIFLPEFVFLGPDRRLKLCYFPEIREELGINVLAEFILKRLDHEDPQAVALGYRFYQSICSENFGLNQIWRELSFGIEMEGRWEKNGYQERQEDGGPKKIQSAGVQEFDVWEGCGYERKRSQNSGEYVQEDGKYKRKQSQSSGEYVQEDGRNKRKRSQNFGEYVQEDGRYERKRSWNAEEYVQEDDGQEKQRDWNAEKYGQDMEWQVSCDGVKEQDTYEVIHKVRKKEKIAVVHPAILLTGLFLFAVIEVLLYLKALSLTEAGGLFFLILSAVLLLNKFWREKKKGRRHGKKKTDLEAQKEEYERLQRDMYQRSPQGQREEAVNEDPSAALSGYRGNDQKLHEEEELEETRCLVPAEPDGGMQMICISGGEEGKIFPDIYVRNEFVYIGKRKGESDVILDSPTVSRMHARLEQKDGKYYVKDLNSRNGTFCNGERLLPQESCEIHAGDEVAFAQIRYRAVKSE